jgi:hypothetical protein
MIDKPEGPPIFGGFLIFIQIALITYNSLFDAAWTKLADFVDWSWVEVLAFNYDHSISC